MLPEPTYHELTSEGHKLAALEYHPDKHNTPIIFLHAITSSIWFWHFGQTPIFNRLHWYSLTLPAHYPAIAPENFHAEDVSPAKLATILMGAIQKLVGNRPFILAGHSTGGFAALALAALYPEQVKGVISIGGFVRGYWTGALRPAQLVSRLPWVGESLSKAYFRKFSRWAQKADTYTQMATYYAADRSAFLKNPYTPATIGKLAEEIAYLDAEAMTYYFQRMPDIDITNWLPRITAPTLILSGDADPIIPADQPRLMAENIPQGQLAWIAGAGHMPMAERQAEYDRIVTEWVEAHALPHAAVHEMTV